MRAYTPCFTGFKKYLKEQCDVEIIDGLQYTVVGHDMVVFNISDIKALADCYEHSWNEAAKMYNSFR